MPTSATITSSDFYTFTANTMIRSAYVNTNFALWRGHVLPVDGSTTAAAVSGSYDLGAVDHYWRGVHQQYGVWYGNTSGSVPTTPASNLLHVYAKGTEVYQKNPAGVEKQVGTFTRVGSRASPNTVTVAGITFDIANGMKQIHFITGDTTTGTDITANPQISAGTAGAELILCVPNTSTSRPVILEQGNGLDQNGWFGCSAGCNIHYFHDGTEWIELTRRDA